MAEQDRIQSRAGRRARNQMNLCMEMGLGGVFLVQLLYEEIHHVFV